MKANEIDKVINSRLISQMFKLSFENKIETSRIVEEESLEQHLNPDQKDNPKWINLSQEIEEEEEKD